MAKKKTPQTAKAYAEGLYCLRDAHGDHVNLLNDWQIIDCRVRAFVDGVNWQKRRTAKRR
jgi:hypothetical protein